MEQPGLTKVLEPFSWNRMHVLSSLQPPCNQSMPMLSLMQHVHWPQQGVAAAQRTTLHDAPLLTPHN